MTRLLLTNASQHPVSIGGEVIRPHSAPFHAGDFIPFGDQNSMSIGVQTAYSDHADLQLYVLARYGKIRDYAVQLTGDYSNSETLDGTQVRLDGDDLHFVINHTFEPWMGRLADDRMLHQITLPGTHDSATWQLGLSSQCQHTSIPQQLYIGARYFDVRLDTDTPHDPGVNHGTVGTHYHLSDVAKMMADFLTGAHGLHSTQETVVLQLKIDDDTDDDAHTKYIVDVLKTAFAAAPDRLYLTPIRMNGSIPTLKDLRGKLVVLRRYEMAQQNTPASCTPIKYFAPGAVYNQWSANPANRSWEQVFAANNFEWPDKTHTLDDFRNLHGLSFVIQDAYTDGYGIKWDMIEAFFNAATTQKPDSWYLNFTSSAVGNPWEQARYINEWLLDLLQKTPAKPRYGTLLMDFITADLARAAFMKNF